MSKGINIDIDSTDLLVCVVIICFTVGCITSMQHDECPDPSAHLPSVEVSDE